MVEVDGKSGEIMGSNGCTHDTSSTNSSGVPKRMQSVQPRFSVGEHLDSHGVLRGMCNYCGEDHSDDVCPLDSHLRECMQNPHNDNTWRFDQELARKALARMIIVDEQPFSLVEEEGFKQFMHEAQPQFKIPSRTTIMRDCFELFCEEKQKLKKLFKETNQRICLTTDTWISEQKIKFICLTAHFIDGGWNLQKRILKFSPISSDTGEDRTLIITKCLLDWGLDKVFTITIDNAISNDITLEKLSKQLSRWGTNMMNGDHLHVKCLTHIINLVVQDGLKEVGDSVKRVRQAVRYIRQLPSRYKLFKDCCEIEKITCERALCLDVPTRWDSTYLMLDTAQEFENAFIRYNNLDAGLLNHLLTYVCEDGKVAGILTSEDWTIVRHMVKVLKIVYDLTLRILGSPIVTSNIYFSEICEVDLALKELIENDDIGLSVIAKRMKSKFDEYWGDPAKMNKMILIACVFDPRYKFGFVDFAAVKMYGEEKGRKIRDEVKVYMVALFEEYRKESSKGSQSPSTLSSNTSATSSKSNFRNHFIMREWLQECKRRRAENGSVSELDKYLGEELEAEDENLDILLWWKVKSSKFPILAEMARDVLGFPISTVASESVFNTGEHILDSFTSSLTPALLQALVCVRCWVRNESLPVRIEEDWNYLEQLESDLTNNGRHSSIIDI